MSPSERISRLDELQAIHDELVTFANKAVELTNRMATQGIITNVLQDGYAGALVAANILDNLLSASLEATYKDSITN